MQSLGTECARAYRKNVFFILILCVFLCLPYGTCHPGECPETNRRLKHKIIKKTTGLISHILVLQNPERSENNVFGYK
jgi:hypothetical protein